MIPPSIAISVGKTKKPFANGFTDRICAPKKKDSRLKYTDGFLGRRYIVIYRRTITVGKSVGECVKYRQNMFVGKSVGECVKYRQNMLLWKLLLNADGLIPSVSLSVSV